MLILILNQVILNMSHEGNLCWIFRNDAGDKEVSLNSNNIVLNYHKWAYKGFKYFLNDVLLIINALKKYKPFKLKFFKANIIIVNL